MTSAASSVAASAPALDLEPHRLSVVPERTHGLAERWMAYLSVPLGLAAFVAIQAMPTPAGLTLAAQSALACFALALIWWIGEPIPTHVTSMVLMLALVLSNAWSEDRVLSVLGLDVIWLNVLAFVLSGVLIKTQLARRLALMLVSRFGSRASTALLAFVILQLALAPLIPATAARAVMTLPLMLMVATVYRASAQHPTNFGRNLFLQNLLGINIFSSGFMTGSTANLMAVGFILTMGGTRVYYTDWMFANLPVALVAMAIAWWAGRRLLFPIRPEDAVPHIAGGVETLHRELDAMGPLSAPEKKGIAIFALVVGLWVTDRFHMSWFGFNIDAVMAAMIGAVIALSPRIGLLSWNDTDIPWHLMIFSAGAYAGGLALDQTGAARWAVQRLFAGLHIGGQPNFWIVYVTVVSVSMYAHFFLTSKTMRAVIMLPLVIGIARQLGYTPLSLALPVAFTLDWVVGLPVSAKPNLILFSTGQYSVLDNLKFGFAMTTLGIVLLTAAGMTWFHWLGITPGF